MTNGSDPAYPKHPKNLYVDGESSYGLTKRELFAAMAMQGILAHSCKRGYGERQTEAMIGISALRAADALIAVLNKPQEAI